VNTPFQSQNPPNAVLLLSGGLDSAANFLLGKNQFEIKVALTVDYGQRSAAQEIQSSRNLASHFQCEHVVFNCRNFSELLSKKGALLSGDPIPHPQNLEDLLSAKKTAAQVWVPNRNGFLISLGAALAESRGLEAVAVGFNAEEAVTFPDNSFEYLRVMNHSLEFSTSNKVKLMSATVEFTKSQIVKALERVEFPFNKLWSCYENQKKQCGKCESCQRFKRAMHRGAAN